MNFTKLILVVFFLIFISSLNTYSQDSLKIEYKESKHINVFVDCSFCDENYIKENINYVNYVRDTKESNVHILVTRQSTGSGGLEYSVFFIGLNDFEYMNDIFKYNTEPDFTSDETRIGLTNVIKAGLVRYLSKTPFAQNISINYTGETGADSPSSISDPWKNWVFDISLSGSFSGEESYTSSYYYSSVSIKKVTDKQKFICTYYTNSNRNKYELDDTTVYKSRTNSNSLYTVWVKSLGEHWSAGFTSTQSSSTYRNIKFKTSIYPSIEYNLFPYKESNSRQLRFLHGIGNSFVRYNDTTIFYKTKETLFAQNLAITLDVTKKWGSISTSLNAFNYFHDLSKNSLNLWTNLSIRLFKGFSVSLYGQFSVIHDQIYLPKTDISTADILLQQRQLATQYSYYGSVGISYTFGSIYNNIVNPRFGE
ncbi:MAG: hypothetical protein A2265_09395 [Bacteroidetes bacterium RIFOXYA12_FULL_33_9]|nr:MAG: hypothetical protein A2265_09395 [Bacteroidetes bacterium RIFOXYA12_FULL_33_9]